MAWQASGSEDFERFAEDVREAQGRVDMAINRALQSTAQEFIQELTLLIQRSSTSKGGTFDSRTSPYQPGGTNDSSEDSLHISEPDAWTWKTPSSDMVVIHPRKAVKDRARFMEFGTKDHGPTGDNPMYFNVAGVRIVVAEPKEGTSLFGIDALEEEGELQDFLFESGEPGEVEGVDENLFFHRAAIRLPLDKALKRNLEREIERLFRGIKDGY